MVSLSGIPVHQKPRGRTLICCLLHKLLWIIGLIKQIIAAVSLSPPADDGRACYLVWNIIHDDKLLKCHSTGENDKDVRMSMRLKLWNIIYWM